MSPDSAQTVPSFSHSRFRESAGGRGKPCERRPGRGEVEPLSGDALYNDHVAGLLWFWLMAGSALLVAASQPAPSLEGQTLDGRAWSDALTGQVTVVEFFATWCPQCRRSLADQHKLAAARQVRLIIVDVDEDPALVRAFFGRTPPPQNAGVLVDQAGRARANWGVTGFPSVFLVDKAGIIRKSFAGWGEGSAANLTRQIDSLEASERSAAAAAAKPATGGRRGRGKAPPPRDRALSPDERARQFGVEVLR
jgi:thiol-disulfide isomerase/thioredoxin